MNKAGMAVDVSHCGDRTTLDAFEISKKPVLITHSNCRALVPGHPRLKTDEVIKKVGEAGSVFGITGVRLNHPKRMFDLTEGLIRRKYSDADIEGILGGNFERVLTQIWTI